MKGEEIVSMKKLISSLKENIEKLNNYSKESNK